MFGVALEVAEAGEEIDRQIHRAGPHRQVAHVGPDERGVRHALRDAQQGRREIQAEAARAGRSEGPGVAAGAAGDVEHPPAGLKRHGADDELHRRVGLGIVPVGVELEIFLTEPLLEPLGHWPLISAPCDRVHPAEW